MWSTCLLSFSGWLSVNMNTHVIELTNDIAAALIDMTTLIGYFIHMSILFQTSSLKITVCEMNVMHDCSYYSM